ncbi:amino acid ABC transporter permease/ATP-binding protein [Paraburkholderia sp. BL10I2N1]|uniref:amino acid ABC transporter permease/ATP-binding protein n=1 Tax=Paraburkholderia sp. BL10I2N1 TaxID=1938796 RepID=UPI00105C9B2F|nr:amino acid ABC transporter permease/ATP-binding protein [Paraburkholderia sp. BL10I2N1]TDN62296.1 amino acid ABC transporter membrane protein (PAAT family) /amino acid ABC transporter ATP-binding protein (PAAT family) [Paraburkholderia sp. BL10I2N1]
MQFDLSYFLSLFADQMFWEACLIVIELGVLSWVVGMVAGYPIALAKLSKKPWLSRPATAYVWFFRSVPLLVVMVFVFNLPQLFPSMGPALSHPFFSAFVSLVVTEAAYMAEIHRGGLLSVGKGQLEAATALGLRRLGLQRLVVIPQAFWISLPTLVNEFITCIKLTSLASVISLAELLMVGQRMYSQNFLVLETLLAIGVYYVMIVTVFGWLLKQLEHWLDLTRRRPETMAGDELMSMRDGLVRKEAGAMRVSGQRALNLKDVRKAYGGHEVLKGIDLDVAAGEVLSIIGPSGSGKTSLIRTINGLESIDHGAIHLFGQPCIDASASADPERVWQARRRIGMVFQGFNLFPHRTILDNVLMAPQYHRRGSKAELRNIGLGLLDKVGLLAHAQKYPHQLSGGQQQRVAIARALAMEPDIMLFDEPTSALDPELVDDVLQVISELAREHMTMIIVTHEMNFAMSISDRIAFMENGELRLHASPDAIRSDPDAERVRRFIGIGAPGALNHDTVGDRSSLNTTLSA